MARIMNDENNWDHNMEDALEGPVVCVSRNEIVLVLNVMKTGKAPGNPDVLVELIAASMEVGMQVMA